MGAGFYFDEVVDSRFNNERNIKCTVEVLDNHSIPEIRIGPEDEAYKGWCAEFKDWEQFKRFVIAVNDLEQRLKNLHK